MQQPQLQQKIITNNFIEKQDICIFYMVLKSEKVSYFNARAMSAQSYTKNKQE